MREFLQNLLLKTEKNGLIEATKRFEEASKDLEEAKLSLNVVDLVREQLKGFNPRLLDNDDDLLVVLTEKGEDHTFLANVKALSRNPAFHRIAEYLMRDQVLLSAKEASTLETINFGRATVNGVSLFIEEVDRLVTVYEDRKKLKPEFDEFEVL